MNSADRLQEKLKTVQERMSDLILLGEKYQIKVALENVAPDAPTELLEQILEMYHITE